MGSDWTAATECAIAARKTSSYLQCAAKFAIENWLPLCLASAWSFKARNEDVAGHGSSRICCLTCGLDLKNRRCFDLKVKDVDDTRSVGGVCCGCRQEYCCGKIQLPSCSESSIASENISNTSGVFDTTFDETAICAVSTPLNKSTASPALSSRITSLQNQAKRSRKRRGSALERLLKEEDSETDRSLSGFLNMVSKH